jgi:hypothetical protein
VGYAGGGVACGTWVGCGCAGGDGSLAPCDPWCACRHRINYQIIRDVIGYDVRIAITEAAPGWGNTQVTLAVLVDDARWVAEIYHDEGLWGVFFWLVGYHPTWPLANLEDWLGEFARVLIEYLIAGL